MNSDDCRGTSFRAPLAWLKSQFGGRQGHTQDERGSIPRKRMRFEAEIQRVDGITPAIGVDINEDGAKVLSKQGWETGTATVLETE